MVRFGVTDLYGLVGGLLKHELIPNFFPIFRLPSTMLVVLTSAPLLAVTRRVIQRILGRKAESTESTLSCILSGWALLIKAFNGFQMSYKK